MFTGIVDHTGKIKRLTPHPKGVTMEIDSNFSELALGESISVNGTCLTVTQIENTSFSVDISPETLELTQLGTLMPDSEVNLERSLTPETRMGGHHVSGHVDQVGKILTRKNVGEYVEFWISGPQEFGKFLFKKGSISVNGVSLTLNEVKKKECLFSVLLIPHTLQRTNLSVLREGDSVNLEFDLFSKMLVERLDDLLLERGN